MNITKIGCNTCSGCGLCVVVCPHKAIELGRNTDGFYEPILNLNKCTDCSICTKVCYKYLPSKEPFENSFKNKEIYGAWSKNEDVVKTSSSGGVGYELTSYYYQNGYKICGCIFDAPNDNCKHIIANTTEELEAIKTSKYLQSNTIEAFSQFKKDEKYLVIGTPCQIYGLRKYIHLKHWNDNFILVDFFCHGAPSFSLWKKYKEFLHQNYKMGKELKFVNFRKKNLESKWHSYAISIQDSSGKKFEQNRAFANDLFYKFFLNNYCLNDACFSCKLRLDHCASDVRIADFWGAKYINNEWGVNLVITNTKKGQEVFNNIKPKLIVENCTYEDLQDSQGKRFFTYNDRQKKTLNLLKQNKALDWIYNKITEPTYSQKIKTTLKRYIHISKSIIVISRDTFKRISGKKKILLLPPTVLNGSFGDEIMTVSFLEHNKDKDITLYLQHIIDRFDLFNSYKNVKQLEWGKSFYSFSEIYLLGADNIAGNYYPYGRQFKFKLLARANKLRIKTAILAFSIPVRIDSLSKEGFEKIRTKTNFYLREEDSYQRARSFLPKKRLTQVADLAFLCPYKKNNDKEYLHWIDKQKIENRLVIAFCPNALQAQKVGLKKYIDEMTNIFNYIETQYNISLALFYHDLRPQCEELSDKDLSKLLFQKRKDSANYFFTEKIKNGVELKSYLEFVDFTFTGRMHFGISGYSLKKPMLGITYEGKFTGLQKLFGLDVENTLIIDYNNITKEKNKIDYFINNLKEINQKVYDNYDKVISLAKKNFNAI